MASGGGGFRQLGCQESGFGLALWYSSGCPEPYFVSDGDRMVILWVGDGDWMVMVLVGHADRMVMVLVGDGDRMVTVLVEGGDW